MTDTCFRHEALFYSDDDEYLEGTIPYLREGLEAGEATMVAVGPEKAEILAAELGADADGVCFADMHGLGAIRRGSSPSGGSSSTITEATARSAGSANRSGRREPRPRSTSASAMRFSSTTPSATPAPGR